MGQDGQLVKKPWQSSNCKLTGIIHYASDSVAVSPLMSFSYLCSNYYDYYNFHYYCCCCRCY